MKMFTGTTTPADLVQLRLREWIEFEAFITREPGRSPRLVEIRAWPSPAFYAFRAALLYSIHRHAALFDWSVLDTIEV